MYNEGLSDPDGNRDHACFGSGLSGLLSRALIPSFISSFHVSAGCMTFIKLKCKLACVGQPDLQDIYEHAVMYRSKAAFLAC